MSDGPVNTAPMPFDPRTRHVGTDLLHPSTLFLIAANATPIFGVSYWGWDVFVLLVLYWMETAIIGLWTIARVAVAPPGSMGSLMVNGHPTTSSSAMAAFFVVHAGIFMSLHMVFLWALFAGEWAQTIHVPRDFFTHMVIGTDLWIPLLLLFAARGLSLLFHVLKPEAIQKLERSLHLPTSIKVPTPAGAGLGSIVSGFYGRIILMHMTIIFSAFLVEAFGSITPLIIMVGLKTATDVGLHLALDFGSLRKGSHSLSAVPLIAEKNDR
jgi:hypothetical protein